jgi:GntR family transcriptional regulator, transcriptional repressor for pyruvate dehydrogenase complex
MKSDEALEFDPIERETISSQIRAQLLRRITTGDLGPGARVPSERDLAEQFHVARTSVREAMQGLLSLGVIERRGNRSFVPEHLPEVIVGAPDGRKGFVEQLFETRLVLEVPIFALAAKRADDQDRQRVHGLAERFDDDLEISQFRRLDREFHTTVASCCGNPLLIELYGKVLDQLFRSDDFEALLSDAKNRPEVRRIVADSGRAHRAIADAFAFGDVVGVSRCAEAHVQTVQQAMVDDLV